MRAILLVERTISPRVPCREAWGGFIEAGTALGFFV